MTSLPKRDKTAFHPDSRIRKGLGKRTQTLFLLNFSFTECLELNLIKTKSFSEYEKLGVEGKNWSISDGNDDCYLLNINKRNIINKK